MLCCVCKEKTATVHLTQIAGEKMQKVDLCEECAKTKGVNDQTGFSLADLLLGLGASQELEQAAGGVDVKCPQCGFSQADFKKSGRLGCAACYQTFAEGLEGLLKSMHKGTRHSGQSPGEPANRNATIPSSCPSCRRNSAKAIETENFEAAAQLRDEIKQVNTRLASTLVA